MSVKIKSKAMTETGNDHRFPPLLALKLLICIILLLFLLYGCHRLLRKAPKPLPVSEPTETVLRPLTADELAAVAGVDL